ncbi:K02A2.6-like [Cordylochernes scorpioides]|uniref:K02A2.6-like n=1 Tax=Cordylochernes scorpioides TaxID=51811 RepID=A0ABY6L3N2_9ARAC|nr:K02A2.6-like [Cordylochernes scorpioides]
MDHFKPPSQFELTLNNAEAWETWKYTFLLYSDAIQLETKPVKQQRAILLHNIGDDALNIYKTFGLQEALTNPTITDILEKFDNHFKPFKNVIYRRYNFFSEVQEKNQSFDDFTKVKNKAVDCDFGDLTESLIRDRIVLGVLDKNLTERYLQDPDLTLSKAIDLGRAAESSRTQLKEIKEEVTVNKLSSYKETSSNKNTEHKFAKKNHKFFKACGKCASKHNYGNCPAYGVGLLKNKQTILIKEEAIPQAYTARRLPLALREPVREELEKMSKLGVIKKINKPTEWSHPMVVVKKPNGDVRICIDPRKLNYWIRREKQVFKIARENGLKFDKNKTQLMQPSVRYLGHIVSTEGIRPLESKRDLKLQLTSAPCLRHFDPKLDIEISTDASSNGLGAVLQQQGVPITYSSTALSAAQKKYSQIEKELLAVYFGCKRNHLYLYGRKFTAFTDHKPLLTIMKKPMVDLSPRLQRLVLQLQHYDFDLKYIPGKIYIQLMRYQRTT